MGCSTCCCNFFCKVILQTSIIFKPRSDACMHASTLLRTGIPLPALKWKYTRQLLNDYITTQIYKITSSDRTGFTNNKYKTQTNEARQAVALVEQQRLRGSYGPHPSRYKDEYSVGLRFPLMRCMHTSAFAIGAACRQL